MTLELTEAEASGSLALVPICAGCHRPATGVRRVRLRVADPGLVVAPGQGDPITTLLALASLAACWLARSAAGSAIVAYPACWRHRRIIGPGLRLEGLSDGRLRLAGLSDPFVAAWQAARPDAVDGEPA